MSWSRRLDDIVAFIQSGQGSIGKIIYDPSLFNRANAAVTQLQQIMTQINSPNGTIGKLLNSDELYNKANTTIDNREQDHRPRLDSGKGTIGKFSRIPRSTTTPTGRSANANQLIDDINAGKGTLGKLAKDEELGRKDRQHDYPVWTASPTDSIRAKEPPASSFKDPALYNNADDLLVETRNLIKAVRQDPKKYLTIHLKIF